jgi:3-methyladenine DNA glycosylase AlkD
MIIITHTCGHTQETKLDRYGDMIHKLGKDKEQFIKEQVEWLSGNLCPECYQTAKDRNPLLKPIGG